MSKQKIQLSVVTYNLLSPAYVKPAYFPNIQDEYLDKNQRLKRTVGLIQKWMKDRAIICLQELCEEWMHHFTKLFSQNNYKFHPIIYANGKSGVSISYPIDLFDTLMVQSDSCFNESMFNKIKEATNNSQIHQELENASQSENKCISVVIETKGLGQKILLSTYHMPCRFAQKFFITSHIHGLKDLLFEISQKYKCNHIILAGDFNITSKNPEYKFLAGICDEKNDPEFIKELRKVYQSIGQNLDSSPGLQSSHFKLHGSEPDYTNVSTMGDGGMFIECLDYCLTTKSIEIKECWAEFKIKNPCTASYPNESCPSDHQPLITTMLI